MMCLMFVYCRSHPECLQKLHDRSSFINLNGLMTKNSGISGENNKKLLVSESSTTDSYGIGLERKYKEATSVYDSIDAVMNMLVAVHQIRPYR